MRLEGVVVHGRRLGHSLGFPTANIQTEESGSEVPGGVYAAWLELEGERLPCMLNVGSHPTLPGGGSRCEAHILHFDGELYGRRVAVETVAYLRPEQHFPSPEALREQLQRDRERCMKVLGVEKEE